MINKEILVFKTNTRMLLNEILQNSQQKIYKIPLRIFYDQLRAVATRCSELNDPVLNKLMCDLSLYAIADQENKNFDLELVDKVEKEYLDYMKKGEETSG